MYENKKLKQNNCNQELCGEKYQKLATGCSRKGIYHF